MFLGWGEGRAVRLGGGWSRRSRLVSEGVGLLTLRGKHLASFSPPYSSPQVRHYYFCKLGQQIFSHILESALYVGTVKHRV